MQNTALCETLKNVLTKLLNKIDLKTIYSKSIVYTEKTSLTACRGHKDALLREGILGASSFISIQQEDGF